MCVTHSRLSREWAPSHLSYIQQSQSGTHTEFKQYCWKHLWRDEPSPRPASPALTRSFRNHARQTRSGQGSVITTEVIAYCNSVTELKPLSPRAWSHIKLEVGLRERRIGIKRESDGAPSRLLKLEHWTSGSRPAGWMGLCFFRVSFSSTRPCSSSWSAKPGQQRLSNAVKMRPSFQQSLLEII